MADYNSVFEILVNAATAAPADLSDTAALDSWLSSMETSMKTELTSQGFTEASDTLACAYDEPGRTKIDYTWTENSNPYAAVSDLTAGEQPEVGRA